MDKKTKKDEHDPSAVDFSDLSPSAIAQIEEICKKEAARKKREEELCKLAQERETLKQKAADDAEGPLEKRIKNMSENIREISSKLDSFESDQQEVQRLVEEVIKRQKEILQIYTPSTSKASILQEKTQPSTPEKVATVSTEITKDAQEKSSIRSDSSKALLSLKSDDKEKPLRLSPQPQKSKTKAKKVDAKPTRRSSRKRVEKSKQEMPQSSSDQKLDAAME